MPRLGIHLDGVAVLRESGQATEPDPVAVAILAEMGGADQISIHLRQDRAHIQDRDANLLKSVIRTRLNLHVSLSEAMVAAVLALNPDIVTLVPEKEPELTLHSGLDVIQHSELIADRLKTLRGNRTICLFIDPELDQIKTAHKLGVDGVALNVSDYAGSFTLDEYATEIERLATAAAMASRLGLMVTLENGVDYQNIHNLLGLEGVHGVIAGHAVIARAMLVGMERAVQELAQWVKRP
ncbi:MAG: pyridoxine 5'-phosphate synthase [Gemmatimonadetes bacterium]|nr:MAG: pyridoxine 5'-phosphate synthase [Gemmatimonadota bacterium]